MFSLSVADKGARLVGLSLTVNSGYSPSSQLHCGVPMHSVPPIIGFVIGVIPGAGATIASFVSYGIEGQYGRRRGQLGSGIAEGIVAPHALPPG